MGPLRWLLSLEPCLSLPLCPCSKLVVVCARPARCLRTAASAVYVFCEPKAPGSTLASNACYADAWRLSKRYHRLLPAFPSLPFFHGLCFSFFSAASSQLHVGLQMVLSFNSYLHSQFWFAGPWVWHVSGLQDNWGLWDLCDLFAEAETWHETSVEMSQAPLSQTQGVCLIQLVFNFFKRNGWSSNST